MFKSIKTVLVCGSFFISLSLLQGCDQVTKLFDYFSSKNGKGIEKIDSLSGKDSAEMQGVDQGQASQDSVQQLPADVLAKVGQWSISLEDFNNRLKALKEVIPAEYNLNDVQNKKFILDELIRQELMVQEAERQGLDKNRDVKMAIEEFRRTLLVRQLADQVVAQAPSATEEEARKYYEENKADLTEWKVREIVTGSEAESKAILVELLQGADFAETAKQKSKSGTAAQGGDLGYVADFATPQMMQTVSAMNIGDTSPVISGPDGFYIFKLEDRKEQSFDQIRDEIGAGLNLLKQQQEIMNLLATLEQKTPVVKNEKLLEE